MSIYHQPREKVFWISFIALQNKSRVNSIIFSWILAWVVTRFDVSASSKKRFDLSVCDRQDLTILPNLHGYLYWIWDHCSGSKTQNHTIIRVKSRFRQHSIKISYNHKNVTAFNEI